MGNLFNGGMPALNPTPAVPPIVPGHQVVIPPITIPGNFQATPTMSPVPQTLNQITVRGKEMARAYKLGPNSRVAIFDEDEQLFYFKETDANGNEIAFTTCSYSEIEEPPEPQYLTVQEFQQFQQSFQDTFSDFAKQLKEELANGKFIQPQTGSKQSYGSPKQQSGPAPNTTNPAK